MQADPSVSVNYWTIRSSEENPCRKIRERRLSRAVPLAMCPPRGGLHQQLWEGASALRNSPSHPYVCWFSQHGI